MDVSLLCQLWASATSVAGVYFYTKRDVKLGSFFGLISQLGWWGFMYLEAAWGLAFINILMLYLHSVALWKECK